MSSIKSNDNIPSMKSKINKVNENIQTTNQNYLSTKQIHLSRKTIICIFQHPIQAFKKVNFTNLLGILKKIKINHYIVATIKKIMCQY